MKKSGGFSMRVHTLTNRSQEGGLLLLRVFWRKEQRSALRLFIPWAKQTVAEEQLGADAHTPRVSAAKTKMKPLRAVNAQNAAASRVRVFCCIVPDSTGRCFGSERPRKDG